MRSSPAYPAAMRRAVTATLLLATLLGACSGESADGRLQALVEGDGDVVGFTTFSSGTDKSFGIFICNEGDEAEIKSVEPIAQEGDIEFLGAVLYRAADQFVGAAHGFPTDGLDESKYEEAIGATVDVDCDSPSGEDRSQLIVGAERTGVGGGMIDGIRVTSSSGELEIPLTILLCGDEFEYCESLIPPTSTDT